MYHIKTFKERLEAKIKQQIWLENNAQQLAELRDILRQGPEIQAFNEVVGRLNIRMNRAPVNEGPVNEETQVEQNIQTIDQPVESHTDIVNYSDPDVLFEAVIPNNDMLESVDTVTTALEGVATIPPSYRHIFVENSQIATLHRTPDVNICPACFQVKSRKSERNIVYVDGHTKRYCPVKQRGSSSEEIRAWKTFKTFLNRNPDKF